jgi:hypothetical protein
MKHGHDCCDGGHNGGRDAEASSFSNGEIMKPINEARLIPVFGAHACVGHLLRTARGFRACDANDKEIGIFETPALGVAALLERATDAA